MKFDVVSVKRNQSGKTEMSHAFPPDGDGMTFTNTPILQVLLFSLDAKPSQVAGLPAWTQSERYDIAVKVVDGDLGQYHELTLADRKLMLQQVFVDRFGLKIHKENRETPAYELTVAKDGPKLQVTDSSAPSKTPMPQGQSLALTGRGDLVAHGASMENLVFLLSDMSDNAVGRNVVDKTGLAGKYDFTLHWAPDTGGDANGQGASGPSIFTALQEQLGLKLKPSKVNLAWIVIDQIERPDAN